MMLSRRSLLKTASATAGLASFPAGLALAAAPDTIIGLTAGKFSQEIRAGTPEVGFWGFNNSVPGAPLRYRKGDTARILVSNTLGVDTAVHWHGLRVPNAMDGVPYVTQDPIKPGAKMMYQYPMPDSGTYWYHPHQSSFEQVPRGMYGAFIVEETRPIEVDQDVVWLLSDIKLGANGQQVEDYGRILDLANAGRIGNEVLVNGKAAGAQVQLSVRGGERIRLRLINAASARIFNLKLAGHMMTVIAFDGQAVEPHAVEQIELGPGMRVDLVIDCLQKTGGVFSMTDEGRRGFGEIAQLAYSQAKSLRDKAMAAPVRLASNQMAEIDLAKAEDHYIIFQGGMRGTPVIGTIDGKPARINELMEKHGLAWTMNYTAQHEHALMHEPLLSLRQGQSVVLHLVNETDYPHPMHIHGHFFKVMAINGKKTRFQEWRDTAMMGPRETLDVAFVADNVGEWMFHCHILDHAAGGMMGTFAVE